MKNIKQFKSKRRSMKLGGANVLTGKPKPITNFNFYLCLFSY